jgi:heme A synthase
VLTALVLFSIGSRSIRREHSRGARFAARCLLGACSAQVAAGALNVMLSAPGWLQVLHLFIANVLWLSLVLLWTELADPRTAV